MKSVGLRMADSHTSNHPEDGFTSLETIRRLLVAIRRRSHPGFEGKAFEPERRDVKVILPKKSQTILDAPLGYVGLKTTRKHSPKRPVIYHWGHGFSEGQNSPSVKSVNNDALVIGATPLYFVYPSNIIKSVADSDDPFYGEDEQTLVRLSLPSHPEANKKLKILGKRKVAFGIPKRALPLKDRAYAELERKCNEALYDLDKNPLVFDMRTEIKVLQGQADGLHSIESERERLKSSEIQLLQEINSLKQDRAAVVSKVIPDVTMKLVRSDDLGVLIAKLVRSSIIYGRCQDFEEVAAIKEPFVLEKMPGYRPSSKEEYDQAGDALANASYPFLAEYVVNPYASLEQLLSKKPPSL
nr:hypothetical protein [Tanacetum cinerariifolium]